MTRRSLLLAASLAAPMAAAMGWPAMTLAQQAPGPRHDEMLGRDFDQLGPGARERVQNAFRDGNPALDDAAMRQRWNAMTPQQRGETLTARERVRTQQRQPQRGPGPGPGPGPGAGPGPMGGPTPQPMPRPMPQPGPGQRGPGAGQGGGGGRR